MKDDCKPNSKMLVGDHILFQTIKEGRKETKKKYAQIFHYLLRELDGVISLFITPFWKSSFWNLILLLHCFLGYFQIFTISFFFHRDCIQ